MEAFFETLQVVVGWVVVFVVVGLSLRQTFEHAVSQPFIEQVVGREKKDRLQKFGGYVKSYQAFLVIGAAVGLSFLLHIDMTTALNSITNVLPSGELTQPTLDIINGVIMAVGAWSVHGVIKFQTGKVKLFGG